MLSQPISIAVGAPNSTPDASTNTGVIEVVLPGFPGKGIGKRSEMAEAAPSTASAHHGPSVRLPITRTSAASAPWTRTCSARRHRAIVRAAARASGSASTVTERCIGSRRC